MTQTATPPSPPAAAPAPSIDPKLIVPLVNSIRAVFTTMVKLDVAINRPHLKTSPAPSYDVSGIIGLSGDLVGSIVVSFQLQAAINVVSTFAGVQLEPQSSDFADAVGELANMIAGGAKKAFEGMASITVPSVVMGSNHQLPRLSDVPCLVIPCHTQAGDFAVEVCIKHSAPASGEKRAGNAGGVR